jgi:uncharacterized membrane protein
MTLEFVPDLLRSAASALSLFAEAIAIGIILVAIIRALIHFGRKATHPREQLHIQHIRLDMGYGLVLALEFLLAADLLRTAVEPSWDELARLGAIVAIRTVLNFFLQREVEHEEEKLHDASERSKERPIGPNQPNR